MRPAASRVLGPAAMVPVLLSLLLAGCGSGAATAPAGASGSSAPGATTPTAPPVSAAPRPASPAVVTIVQPTANEVISGAVVHIVMTLENAQIVATTTTAIRPDQGHVHLYVDNQLVSMNYHLTEDLPVQPGTYLLKAEFVASDHAPFNPRVWSNQVLFTVH
jgi:hypothetical protein